MDPTDHYHPPMWEWTERGMRLRGRQHRAFDVFAHWLKKFKSGQICASMHRKHRKLELVVNPDGTALPPDSTHGPPRRPSVTPLPCPLDGGSSMAAPRGRPTRQRPASPRGLWWRGDLVSREGRRGRRTPRRGFGGGRGGGRHRQPGLQGRQCVGRRGVGGPVSSVKTGSAGSKGGQCRFQAT